MTTGATTQTAAIGKRAWTIIGAVAVWHLVVGATLWVTDVEAYYWVWSQDLQLNYFDHPVMLPLLLRVFTDVLGATPLGVRAVPAFLNLVAAWALSRTTRLLGGSEHDAFITACIFYLTPMYLLSGFAAAPDAPVACFTALTIMALVSAVVRPGSRDPLWVGALLGLAFISKISAGVVGVGAIILCMTQPALRSRLRSPMFAGAIIVAAAVVSPIIIWNLDHDWATLRYHGGRPGGLTWGNFEKLLGGQLAFYAPPTLAAFILLLLGKDRAQVDRVGLRHLGWPSLLFFTYIILRTRTSEPQWTALGYMPAVVLLTFARPLWKARWPRLMRAGEVLSLLMMAGLLVVFHVHMYTGAIVRLMPAEKYAPRDDLRNDIIGYDEVKRVLDRMVAEHDGKTPLVTAAAHYTICGQLGFVMQDRPPVVCPSPREDAFDHLRGRVYPPPGATVLFLTDDRFTAPPERFLRFARCEEPVTLDIMRGGKQVRTYRVHRCHDYQGSP